MVGKNALPELFKREKNTGIVSEESPERVREPNQITYTRPLRPTAACRGALNGLMAEVLEGHIRFHVLDPKSGKNAPQVEAAEELIDVVRTYLK